MRVPVGRFLRAGELHGAFEVLDRCMKIGPAHQGTSEGEVGGGGARSVPDLLGEREGVPCGVRGARHLRLRAR